MPATLAAPPVRKFRTIRPATGKARLVVMITPDRGTPSASALTPIAPDPGSGVVRAFALAKLDDRGNRTGKAYHVRRDAHGVGCDCPDFTFSRDGKDDLGCKHCRTLVAFGIL